MFVYSRKLPVITEADILVVGSGSAGATAAISAAITASTLAPGSRVLLVERYGFLGGTSTMVLDTFYGFYTPGRLQKKVVSGVPDLVIDELRKLDRVIERPNTYGAGTGLTYNPEYLKIAWERLAVRSGVELLYHTFVTDVVVENGTLQGVIVDGKGGLGVVRARMTIDATGDADVAARAGVRFERAGDLGPAQTLTTTFRIAQVDTERARRVPRKEFLERLNAAAESGRYDLPRREGSVHITPLDGVMATIMTRIAPVDPSDAAALSSAETEGRRQALEYKRFLRERIPGYERARLTALSTQVGIRETRRIEGEYRVTREDVLGARKFGDVVALCGAPIEDHREGATTRWAYMQDGETVDIPYRSLVPRGVEGLLVAGRCFSAAHDAHAALRSMAQCMAMGQAAGCAAVLALTRRETPRELSVPALESELRRLGATLETPSEAVTKGPSHVE